MMIDEAIKILKEIIEEGWLISDLDKCTAIDACKMAIEALKQEPCDTISRQAVIDLIKSLPNANSSYWNKCDLLLMAGLIDDIEQLPSVSTEKTGRWIFVDKAKEHAHCSECDYGNVDLFDGRPHNYCPNCGARLIEPQESEDEK